METYTRSVEEISVTNREIDLLKDSAEGKHSNVYEHKHLNVYYKIDDQ